MNNHTYVRTTHIEACWVLGCHMLDSWLTEYVVRTLGAKSDHMYKYGCDSEFGASASVVRLVILTWTWTSAGIRLSPTWNILLNFHSFYSIFYIVNIVDTADLFQALFWLEVHWRMKKWKTMFVTLADQAESGIGLRSIRNQTGTRKKFVRSHSEIPAETYQLWAVTSCDWARVWYRPMFRSMLVHSVHSRD